MTLEGSLQFSKLFWASHSGCVPLIGYSKGSFEFAFLGKLKEVQHFLCLANIGWHLLGLDVKISPLCFLWICTKG